MAVPPLPNNFELEFISPNIIALKTKGDFGDAEVDAVFDRIDSLVGTQPFWLFEVDISELGHASPEARRTGAQRIGKTPEYSLALFGGGLAQRAISTLFLKLSELFSGNRDISTTFAKDQASARAWLLEESRRRLAKRRS